MGRLCFCRSVHFTLFICKIFGCFPISWKHSENKCVFYVSKFWTGYSVVLLVVDGCLLPLYVQKISKPFQYDRKLLIRYISDMNDNAATLMITVIIIINLYKSKQFAKMMNMMSSLTKYDLMCLPSLKVLRSLTIIFCVNFIILYVGQYSTILFLNLMDNFETNWTYERLLMPIIQNTPLLFTSIVGCKCSIIIVLLTCYERLMMHYLKFTPIHPYAGFDETNERRTISFLITFQRCKNSHKAINHTLDKLEIVEYLKYVYGRITECIDLANNAFSPQLLIYITYEIVLLVFHWYAIIIFFTNENPSPSDSTINAFNWLFVITHTIILMVFLEKSQEVETMVIIFCLIKNLSSIQYNIHNATIFITGKLNIFPPGPILLLL